MVRNYQREYLRGKRGLHRHPIIGKTQLSPMHRFLSETHSANCAAPQYTQQWKTLLKAERLGYITEFAGLLTEKGKAELIRLDKRLELAINSGAVTATQTNHKINTGGRRKGKNAKHRESVSE